MRVHLANWSLLLETRSEGSFYDQGPSATQDVPELVERKIRNQIEQHGGLLPRPLANGSRVGRRRLSVCYADGYRRDITTLASVIIKGARRKGHGLGNAK